MDSKELVQETEAVASYLISLFYKSGKIYSTPRLKINKLLIIHSLCNKEHPELLRTIHVTDEGLFNDPYYYFSVLYRDTYLNIYYKDDKEPYMGDFDANFKVPFCFEKRVISYPLDDYTMKLLEEIFRNFASYKNNDLIGPMDKVGKVVLKTNNYRGSIINNDFQKDICENYDIGEYRNNKVFSFIKNKLKESNQYNSEKIKKYY